MKFALLLQANFAAGRLQVQVRILAGLLRTKANSAFHPFGSVNEYQLRLGRKGQPFVNIERVDTFKLLGVLCRMISNGIAMCLIFAAKLTHVSTFCDS